MCNANRPMYLQRELTRTLPLLLLFFLLPVAGSAEEKRQRANLNITPVFPGRTWARKSPEEVGLDAAILKKLPAYVKGSGFVVRYGYQVFQWGNPERRRDVASAAKPVYTHFFFKALESGKIKDVNQPVARWVPELKKLNSRLGFKDRRMTWRHLANQTACYGVAEPPGTAFDYNDWQMALFWDALFLKVYGVDFDTADRKVLHPLLTDRLQCQDKPTFMAFGTGDRAGRIGISPRDFARFALLYLRRGRWKNKQLIPEKYAAKVVSEPLPNSIPRTTGKAAEMLPDKRSIGSRRIPDNQCDHIGSYSWLWWVNGIDRAGRRHWPDAPPRSFGCFGHGGMRAVVALPELNLIISWNDSKIQERDMENHALGLLTKAVVSSAPHTESSSQSNRAERASGGKPLPGQVILDPETPGKLSCAGDGPFFICGPGDPEGFLYRGTRNADGTRNGDQTALIKKLAGTGANCIYLMAVRSHGGDGDGTHNPFVDNDPKQGVNRKVLDQWAVWFYAMDAQGIIIYFFIYDDSARVWKTGDRVGDAERSFVRILVKRFASYKHLIWCIAEEYGEALSATRVKRLARLIKEYDPHDHVIAVHKNHGLDFSEFAGDQAVKQFAVQYNVDTPAALHEGMVKAVREAQGRYSVVMSEAADFGTGEAARRKSWACAMAGVPVMILGMDIAGTSISDLKDCGRLVRFMTSTAFNSMNPADELACVSTEYVLADPGRSYILYSSAVKKTLGLKTIEPGAYRLRWFDCATGREQTGTIKVTQRGKVLFLKPEGIGREAALYCTETK